MRNFSLPELSPPPMKTPQAAAILAVVSAACICLLSAVGARPPIDASAVALAQAGGAWLYLFLAALIGALVSNAPLAAGCAVALAFAMLIYVG